MNTTHTAVVSPLDLTCDTCGAEPTAACVTLDGQTTASRPHSSRQLEAEGINRALGSPEPEWYGSGPFLWTVLCKLPSDPRGVYSEELDVRTRRRSPARALAVARDVLARDYDPALRPARVIQRVPGTWF